MKHYTRAEILSLTLTELRISVAEQLGYKIGPSCFLDLNGKLCVSTDANPGISYQELPDWTRDLTAAASLKIPGHDMIIRISEERHYCKGYFLAVAEYWKQNGNEESIYILKSPGATEAEARCRAWLMMMQEESNV